MARPSVDPDWAESDVVDPTSGQNNKVEPPAAWKDNGWSYQEKPPRNYDNWVKWNLGQWIKYLDEVGIRTATYSVAASDAAAETKLHADAVCDGTDDHVQINAALAAVGATGGIVLLSEGTFTVNAEVTMVAGVHLRGAGRAATIIEVDTSASTDFSVLAASSVTNVSVSDLTVKGNATSITQNTIGIEVDSSSHVLLQNLEINTIDRDASDGDGIKVSASSYVTLINCYVESCVGNGILVAASSSRVRMAACMARSCETGIKVDASSYCDIIDTEAHSNSINGIQTEGTSNRILGCTARGNTAQGIVIADTRSRVQQCHVEGNGQHGIDLLAASAYCAISDNTVYANGQSVHNSYSGILIANGADHNHVAGNTVKPAASSPIEQYAIGGASFGVANSNYVYGNDLTGTWGTSAFPATPQAKTIPEWTGSGASANAQDDVTKANRIA